MRARLPFLAFGLLVLPLGVAASLAACGGGDSPADAGNDGTIDAAKDVALLDTGPDVLDAGCANDVDLTQYLPSADASIDVDAGGLDISACTGCFKDNCSSQINSCNQNCDCRGGVIDFVTCVGGGGALSQCVGDALASGNTELINLIGCASNKCVATCLPAGDAGADAGGDAATDAAADAASE